MPLIVGAIRSGTTLLRLMLDSHSLVVVPPETSFPEDLFRDACNVSGEEIAARVIESKKWADLGLRESVYRAGCSGLPGADALRLVWEMYRRRYGKAIVGDKSPGYVRYLPAVERALPEIRVIHLIRDGRDCYASQLVSRFSLFSPAIRSPTKHAQSWCANVSAGRSAGRSLRHYMEVRFESLIQDPEGELKRICSFLGIDFESQMLRYHERAESRLAELGSRTVAGDRLQEASQRQHAFELTRSPPDEHRIGRWLEVLLRSEIEEFESTAGPLLTVLGYEPASRYLAGGDATRAYTARQTYARFMGQRDYSAAKRYAVQAFRADPSDLRNCLPLIKAAEWTLDFPVQWRMDVESDVMLVERFPSRILLWRGEPPSPNAKLLVWRSHKDVGADLRYSSLLANLGEIAPNCVVEVDARLVSLLKRRFPQIEIVARGGALPDCVAFHASWELLGHYLAPSPAAIPKLPWLVPDPVRVRGFRSRPISSYLKPLVALSWHSSNTDKRLPPLESWRHILGVRGVDFVSAQYTVSPSAVSEWGQLARRVRVVEGVDLRDDLDGLGALLAACDLVVTISATPAHLSGGLGVATWIVLYEEPRLSWPLGRSTTPWYPEARLVWVADESEWETCMLALASDLRAWACAWRKARVRGLLSRIR